MQTTTEKDQQTNKPLLISHIELRKILIDRNMNQRDFAKLVHHNEATISRWLNGRQTPGLRSKLVICQVLEIEPETIGWQL